MSVSGWSEGFKMLEQAYAVQRLQLKPFLVSSQEATNVKVDEDVNLDLKTDLFLLNVDVYNIKLVFL